MRTASSSIWGQEEAYGRQIKALTMGESAGTPEWEAKLHGFIVIPRGNGSHQECLSKSSTGSGLCLRKS